MNKTNLIKIISIICLIVVIANLFLFAFHVYADLVFWSIIIVAAIVAFPVLKLLKRT